MAIETHAYKQFGKDSPSFLVREFSVRKKEFVSAFLIFFFFFFCFCVFFFSLSVNVQSFEMSAKKGLMLALKQYGYLITPATNKDRTTIRRKDTNNREKKINEGKNRIFTEVECKNCAFVQLVYSFAHQLIVALPVFKLNVQLLCESYAMTI